jgi:AraC-like DNA-binding protein
MQLSSDIYQRIVAAKVFIDSHYHKDINLEQISKRAYLSRFHFHRLFRQIYKRTPLQYITHKRIERAKDLLAENKPVAEVCAEVGFASAGSFSLLFKKGTGFPPAYFRNMARLKMQQEKSQPKKFIPHCFIDNYKLDKKSNNQ